RFYAEEYPALKGASSQPKGKLET
ncbi:MAG: hypothetical protein RLZZ258_1190, partial [Actinomycetota bacterium]